MLLTRLDDVDEDVAGWAALILETLTDFDYRTRKAIVERPDGLALLYAALRHGDGDERADHSYTCLNNIVTNFPKETLAAALLAAQTYRRRASFYAFVGETGPLIRALRVEAGKQLRAAEGGECEAAVRHAIGVAEEVGVYPEDVARARRRLVELQQEGEREVRRSELGVGLSVISYPHEFKCPITLSKLVDPVVASDGNTYERKAIKEVLDVPLRHLGDHVRSPLTREVLDPSVLVSNHALRKRIRDYEEEIVAVAEAARRAQREELLLKRGPPAAKGGEDVTSPSSGPTTSRSSRKRQKQKA